jgi:hypothetical protein
LPPEPNSKTGTSIVKTAPPKETARITVKPNLPPTAVRAAGNFPLPKPAPGGAAVPAVAAAAAGAVGAATAAKAVVKPAAVGVPKPAVSAKPGKPATTIVKTGGAKVAPAAVKPAATPAAVATPAQFQEEGSTTLTTVLAGVLALLTWGTAIVLILSYNQII